MSRSALILSQFLFLAVAGMLSAEPGVPEDRPAVHVPVKKPSRQDLDRAEAQKLYGLGVLLERDNKLIEALKTFEEALRLDPDSTPLLRALVPLYLALDRTDEVYRTCERALELDPDDFDTGYLYARQLRLSDRSATALAVLARLAERPALKAAPEMQARISYDRGLLHEGRSEWAEAVTAFRQTLSVLDQPGPLLEQGAYTKEELLNQSAETYERLGRAYLKQNKTREATVAFEQAKKHDPLRAARLTFNLAEVLSSQGELSEALLRLNEYLSTRPSGMEAYELKIQLLRKLDREREILAELKEASGKDPFNLSLKLLLAREYRLARRTPDAERIYQELIQSRPTPEVYKELFALYKEDGSGAGQVLNLLDAAVKRAAAKEERGGDPATEAARARSMFVVLRDEPDLVKKLLVEIHRRLTAGQELSHQTRLMFAGLALRTRQLDLAERLYRSCLGSPEPSQKEHEIYAGLLRVLKLAQKHQAVVEVCKQGLEQAQTTNRVLFHLELSQALMHLGKTKEALTSADDAVNDSSDKDRLECRLHRALLLSQAEKHDKALAECRALLKEYNLSGDQREIRYTLSGLSAAKEPEKAEEQLKLILETDPGDATANNDLGYLWADRNKNLTEAETLIRKAVELDRKQRREGAWVGLDADLDNPAYIDSLGWVLFRRGQLKQAREHLERASQLPGGGADPVIWDHLGDVLFRVGERAGAQQAWKKSLELYEVEQRRRPDDHYRELEQKLRQTEP